ncbi:MAG: YvcK family protein [Verrucomicrobia bacterium]|nr:YvcK family protein [Verrucomicrobiota bacterium]
MLKVLTIGGGSGQFALLSSLRSLPGIEITSVVSMVDSGGSTGRLRDELGILPPGDILKCLLALSPEQAVTRKILQSRFSRTGRLKGHSVGNLLLTFLSTYTGSFAEGVSALADVLGVRGKVLPVTVDRATLVAELTDGRRIFGEAAIDVPRGNQREKIKNTYLVPHHNDHIEVYPPVLDAIQEADVILIGPGDLFTSVIPNFNVPGVGEAISQAPGKVLYNVNIMTKYGETDEFTAMEFVHEIEKHANRQMDYVMMNSARPDEDLLDRYKTQKSEFVEPVPAESLSPRHVFHFDLLDQDGGIVRHDPEKFGCAMFEVFRNLD